MNKNIQSDAIAVKIERCICDTPDRYRSAHISALVERLETFVNIMLTSSRRPVWEVESFTLLVLELTLNGS